MSETPAATRSLKRHQLITTMKTLQFAWFIGHALVLLGSSLFFSTLMRGSRWSTIYYKSAYYGVIESFGIIIYQLVKSKSVPNPRQFLSDDNVQYFLIAAFWLYFAPVTALSLLPFVLFSFFHVISYVRAYLLPILYSNNSPIQQNISNFVQHYNDKSIYAATYFELVTYAWLFLKFLTFRANSFLPFVIYSVFIKFRYEKSVFTRNIVKNFEVSVDGVVSQPSVPAGVRQGWFAIKQVIRNYSTILVHDYTKAQKAN